MSEENSFSYRPGRAEVFRYRPGWALILVIGIAGGQMLGCSSHSVERERGIEPSVIALALPELLGEPARPVVEFDHESHTSALEEEGCKACHPSEADGSVLFKFKRAEYPENKDALMNFYHDGCMDCHEQRVASDQKAGPTACGDCHLEQAAGRSARAAMRFDYSLHGRHSEAESKKCETCHHVYNQEKRQLEYKKGAESACADCHGDRDDGSNPSLANASHADCINCHMERAGKGKKAGPADCVGCHDAARQQTIEKLADIPRLELKRPERVWIDVEEGKSEKVAFDHASHEPLTESCSTCHHKTLKACGECHTLRGSEKGNGVTAEIAYHADYSEHSCVGCHEQKTDEVQCAGCHQSLETPPTELACRVCHSGPDSPTETGSPPAEQMAAIQAGSPAPCLAEMAPTLATTAAPSVVEARLQPLPAFSDDFPERVTIKAIASEYKPSILPHGKIVAALDRSIRESRLAKRFHGTPEALCSGCHHQTPIGVRPPACGSCHADEASATLDKPALKVAYHRQCIGCHQKMGIEKQGCTDCHDKASEEVTK